MSAPATPPSPPVLVPVGFLNLKVKNPNSILSHKTYSRAIDLVDIDEWKLSTVPNKLGLELEATGSLGIDHITADTDAGVNKLDCQLYGKTLNGTGVYIHYYGVIKATESIGKILSGGLGATSFELDYITNNPVFLFADTVEEKYSWAVKENFIGKGRFVRDETSLYVQYYIYVLN